MDEPVCEKINEQIINAESFWMIPNKFSSFIVIFLSYSASSWFGCVLIQ
jgi:hypothetical protein